MRHTTGSIWRLRTAWSTGTSASFEAWLPEAGRDSSSSIVPFDYLEIIVSRYQELENPTRGGTVEVYTQTEEFRKHQSTLLEQAKSNQESLEKTPEAGLMDREIADRCLLLQDIREFQDFLFGKISCPLTTRDALALLRLTIPRDLRRTCRQIWVCRKAVWLVEKIAKRIKILIFSVLGIVLAALLTANCKSWFGFPWCPQ